MASNARSSAMVGFALAIAVALLLVVVLRAGADRSTRQPPPPPALVAQAAATPAVDAVDSDAPAPRVEVATDEPTVRAFAKLRRAVGALRAPYVGGYDVRDDRGRVLAAGETVNNDEIAFALPATARAVVVTPARGYRPVCVDDLASRVPCDLGEVVFAPDAGLRLHVTGLPAGWQGSVLVMVEDGSANCGQVRGALDGDGANAVAVPSGRALTWSLAADGDAFACAVRGEVTPLEPGEARAVAVDCAAVHSQRFRVTDVAAELLPYLRVRGSRNHALTGVRLDAEGRGELRSEVVEDHPYLDGDDDVPLVASLRPTAVLGYLLDEIVLRPWERVAGVQLRAADGTLVPFHLGFSGAPHGTAMQAEPLHLVARRRLDQAAFAVVWSEATGSLRVPAAAWAAQGDLVVLDARCGVANASLCVTGTGARPRSAIALQLVDTAGAVVHTARCDAATAIATILGVAPGTYDLRWTVSGSLRGDALGGTPDAWIARGVTLAAGERRELAAPWPVRVAWSGEVADFGALPASHRFHTVRFGTSEALADGGARLPLDRDGHFAFELPPEAQPDREAVLFAAMMGAPCAVATIDAADHRVVVALPPDLRWVDLDVALPRGAPWTAIMVRADRPGLPWMVVRNDDRRALLVPPGVVLAGSLCDGHGFGDHALAWFRTDGSQPIVRVAPAGGHWVAVRGRADAWLGPVGPDGAIGPGVQPGVKGSAQLWVPDGTVTLRGGREGDRRKAAEQEFDPASTAIDLR